MNVRPASAVAQPSHVSSVVQRSCRAVKRLAVTTPRDEMQISSVPFFLPFLSVSVAKRPSAVFDVKPAALAVQVAFA